MGFAYSNNGLSWRAWNDPNTLASGEVYFPSAPTNTQLATSFPNYSTASSTAQLVAGAGTALMAGITISTTGTLVLNDIIFPTDPATQAKLSSIAATIGVTSAFPGGVTTLPMKDAVGNWHSLTLSQWKAIAGEISAYAATLQLIIDGNPLNVTSLPASSATLTV